MEAENIELRTAYTLPFDGACRHTTDQIFLHEKSDDDDGDHGDRRSCTALPPIHRHSPHVACYPYSQRIGLEVGQLQGEQQFIPGALHDQNDCRGYCRLEQRNDYPGEDADPAAPLKTGRFDQLIGDIGDEAGHQPRHERQ